jgi:hypothetical protein
MIARLAIFLFFCVGSVQAHIGTKNEIYEGEAGPYSLRVFIQPPPVVPGRAQVQVRIHNEPGGVTGVTALPVRWDAGRKGAPPPDRALPVRDEPGLYSTELWIMDFGAYSVFVDVAGKLGEGTAIVPFNSISSRRLEMPPWMGFAFLAAGLALVLFLVAIVGAAFRESVLPPNALGDPVRLRRARWGMVGAVVLLAAILAKGNAWWNAVDAHFRHSRLYKTLEMPASLVQRDGRHYLHLTVKPDESNWRDRTPLIADHGKLMHLFLIDEGGMQAFAHLHPRKIAENDFEIELPSLPPGTYAVYADINHESGLTQTLVAKVDLPEVPAALRLDPDDSTWTAATVGSSAQPGVPLPRGGIVRAASLIFTPDTDSIMRFEALGPDGGPLPLEPYLGMWGHAVVRSHDGTVFTHLHPSGTISMASQELFARRERGEDLRKPIDVLCGRIEREITFPFSFPAPGKYRIWVQLKSQGEIQTAAFDIEV